MGASAKQEKLKSSILIIEDERFLCALMVRKLENSGFEVRSVFDGETGLKELEGALPDLILLDLLLPGINGLEVLRRLKSDKHFEKIPVVIISNLGEPSDVARGLREGAVAYLVKAEFSPQQIVDKVREVLS
jgi:two-component system phosphate regulon response regulator PhoB